MTRFLLCLLFFLLPLVPDQPPAGHSRPGQAWAQPKPAPAAAAISPEQARAVLDTLNDPKKRAAFTAILDALIKGQTVGGQTVAGQTIAEPPPPPPPPPPEPPPDPAAEKPRTAVEGIAIQLAPNSLGAQVLLTASAFVSALGDDVVEAFQTVQSLPLLWGWVVVMITNPMGQRLLAETGWHLLTALAVALLARWALRRLLRRPVARVLALGTRHEPAPAEEADPEARAEQGETEAPPPVRRFEAFGPRLRLGMARFALEMAPVLALLLAGHMVAASSLGGQTVSRLVILAVIDATAACQTLLALKTLLFMSDPPGLRVLPLRRPVGASLMIWSRRLILIGVPGYTMGEVGLLLGLSAPAHDALQKTVGLVLLVCLALIVIRRRRVVRGWLSAAPDSTSRLARTRNRLARRWHWVALFFLAALWLSWTLRAPDAIARSLWYFAATGAVLVGAAVARVAASALIGASGEGTAGDHSIRTRLNLYRPALARLARWLINVLGLLGIAQLFGLNGLTWLLTSDVGHRVISGIATLSVTIGLAFLVWEAVNIAIQLHLETLRREAQAVRSARLRTLLPLVRTALSITIVVVAGLMVLSEIGVNIAPLLAGAGIVGVAIGFGSQKLVQDVITGVFLLLENTMQVGDVVRVGDQSGMVESLSVRTIRLRTEDGSVVVIPFSAVTTVVNMTRDFSRAVIAVNVGVGEDVDRVVEAMRAIVREMREEDAWSAVILDELEVWGLDKFTDSALLIKCRIMCTPFGRWPVGREFNKRMKARFAALGIEMPYPHMKLVVDAPLVPPPPGTSLSVAGCRGGLAVGAPP